MNELLRRYRRLKDRALPPDSAARRIYDRATWAVKRRVERLLGNTPESNPYARWRLDNEPGAEELRALGRRVDVAGAPRLSLVMAVGGCGPTGLKRQLGSLERQVDARWQLCVAVCDTTPRPSVRLLRRMARRDGRIRLVPLAADALGAALAAADGDYVLPIEAGDELAPDATARVVEALLADRALDIVYSDEDVVDGKGRRADPFFKPDWSPDLLMSMNYVGHLVALRRALVADVGGVRRDLGEAAVWDLVLRAAERTDRIAHLPRVLYHARSDGATGATSVGPGARRALADALHRRGYDGDVAPALGGAWRARYRIVGQPRVSIIIPTRDKVSVLRTCVESIEARSTWRHYELIIVDNGSVEDDTHRYLDELRARGHRVLRDERPFNWSALNNLAAASATGEQLLFLNNDVEVIDAGWLEAMLEHAQRREVGVVGARLIYGNDTIQHAGVVLGVGGTANHAFRHLPRDAHGYRGWLAVVRNYSAVTGACLMTRRELFAEVGGFDERLPVAYNDVDYCLRVRARGLYVVYTPFASLYHYESTTRGSLHPPADEALTRERWAAVIERDPFYSPHLTRAKEDFGLRIG